MVRGWLLSTPWHGRSTACISEPHIPAQGPGCTQMTKAGNEGARTKPWAQTVLGKAEVRGKARKEHPVTPKKGEQRGSTTEMPFYIQFQGAGLISLLGAQTTAMARFLLHFCPSFFLPPPKSAQILQHACQNPRSQPKWRLRLCHWGPCPPTRGQKKAALLGQEHKSEY